MLASVCTSVRNQCTLEHKQLHINEAHLFLKLRLKVSNINLHLQTMVLEIPLHVEINQAGHRKDGRNKSNIMKLLVSVNSTYLPEEYAVIRDETGFWNTKGKFRIYLFI